MENNYQTEIPLLGIKFCYHVKQLKHKKNCSSFIALLVSSKKLKTQQKQQQQHEQRAAINVP